MFACLGHDGVKVVFSAFQTTVDFYYDEKLKSVWRRLKCWVLRSGKIMEKVTHVMKLQDLGL